MIALEHECFWTRHRRTELTMRGRTLSGAGVPLLAFKHAAVLMGLDLAVAQDPDDEYEEKLRLGVHPASLHDGCLFQTTEANPYIDAAIFEGVLHLHALYLGCDSAPTGAKQAVLSRLSDGSVVRLQSNPRTRYLEVRRYAADSSWFRRYAAQVDRFAC